MPKGRKRPQQFSVKAEEFSGGNFRFKLLEEFQRAVRLNVRLSVTFRMGFVVNKVPLQQIFSDCFQLHLSVPFQHAPHSLNYHQRYIAADSVFK
jgi:hypothetical protein